MDMRKFLEDIKEKNLDYFSRIYNFQQENWIEKLKRIGLFPTRQEAENAGVKKEELGKWYEY